MNKEKCTYTNECLNEYRYKIKCSAKGGRKLATIPICHSCLPDYREWFVKKYGESGVKIFDREIDKL